jgi:predicted GIY-YIG superfamily endonuclease
MGLCINSENNSESNDPELVEGPKPEIWFVYICQSMADHYYIGISPNPLLRTVKHNKGIGAKMARDQGHFKLLYISSPFQSKSEARKREMQLKNWTRAKKEKLIRGEWK